MQKIQIQSSRNNYEPIISIDFGTTTCLVGIKQDNDEFSIVNFNSVKEDEPIYSLPSIIAFNDKNEFLIGKTTNEYSKIIHSIKRTLGHAKDELMLEELRYFFDINQNSKSNYGTLLKINNNQTISNLEIITYIFAYLKKITEQQLNKTITKVILTAPVYFDERAKAELRFCAEQANLQIVKIIPEPVAAIYSHNLKNGIYLVFDIGGGTFDLSIIQLYENIHRVIANDGNRYIGGDQIDIAILNALIEKYSLETLNIISNNNAINLARNIKENIYLTSASYIQEHKIHNKTYAIEFNLEELKVITLDFINKILPILHQTLSSANRHIDGVVFVGSTTKIDEIQKAVMSLLPDAKKYISIDPSTSVALGAIFHIYASSNALFQVSPLSLGIEIMGGVVEKIIDRNTQLPVISKRTFTNYAIEQNKVKINILEGEREIVSACKSLGIFEVLIPNANPGAVKIEIIFSLDFNAELLVTAIVNEDKKTFFKYEPFKDINLKEEIYNSITHHATDLEAKELSTLQVKAQILVSNLTKLHKIKSLKQELLTLLNKLQSAIEQNNIEKLDFAIHEINEYYSKE